MLEVCCFSVCAVVHAVVHGGARRVEFCARRDLDGISPSLDDVRRLVEFNARRSPADRFELFVMVRNDPSTAPTSSGGDIFVVKDSEEMRRYADFVQALSQITAASEDGDGSPHMCRVDGVVFGAIRCNDSTGGRYEVDTENLRLLAHAATACGIRGFTFHRAFDWIGLSGSEGAGERLAGHQREQLMLQGIRDLCRCGVERVLTSGFPGEPAVRSAELLAGLQLQANASISKTFRIMSGGGITPLIIEKMQSLTVEHSAPILCDFHGSFLPADSVNAGGCMDECSCLLHDSYGSASEKHEHQCASVPDIAAIRIAVSLLRSQHKTV